MTDRQTEMDRLIRFSLLMHEEHLRNTGSNDGNEDNHYQLMMFFWVWVLCGLACEANVSEKHTVSIFRSEVTMLGIRGKGGRKGSLKERSNQDGVR
jgi:hypothetical protein